MNVAATNPTNVRALLDPGVTTEKWSWVCSTGAGTIRTQMPVPTLGWSVGFHAVNKQREFHETVSNGAPAGTPKYLFKDFAEVGKMVVARESGTQEATVDGAKVIEFYTIDIVHTPKGGANEAKEESDRPKSTPTPKKPVGPKTTDATALPAELKTIPMPPQFGVVEGSTSRAAPGGIFESAQASLWGEGSIQQVVDFYNQALAADWIPGDESVGPATFSLSFTSKPDKVRKRVLELDGRMDSGGIRVLETLR